MNRRKTQDNNNAYREWKKKEEVPKEVNMASFGDFPELVAQGTKKTVFTGTSLASKLKEVIAAEEDAAIMKRLKKNSTQDAIREGFVVLPLTKNAKNSLNDLELPEWMTDMVESECIPSFKHKSLDQLAKERKWRRYGVNPSKMMLYNIAEPVYMDDQVSLPDISEDRTVEEDEMVMEES
jgi:hypothetical protein